MFHELNWKLPLSYRQEDITSGLSCDWQIYLRCTECSWEERWDPGFGMPPENTSESICQQCKKGRRYIVRHLFHLECMCRECEQWFETTALGMDEVRCVRCGSRYLTYYGIRIWPEFPKRFGEAMDDRTWGRSGVEDGQFMIDQIQSFNFLPDRALHFLPLIRLCDRLIWASEYEDEDDLGLIWNACGNFLRDYFRETGEAEAGIQAIDAFQKSIEQTRAPLQRALVEHNVAMACYSLLVRHPQPRLTYLGAPQDLRAMGLEYAEKVLQTFVAEKEPAWAMQIGRMHHLLGDLLKIGDASPEELQRAVEHYNQALHAPDMPERLRMAMQAARASVLLRLPTTTLAQRREACEELEVAAARDESDRAFSDKWLELHQLGDLYWRESEWEKAIQRLEHAAALALHEVEMAQDEGILYHRAEQYAGVFDSLFRAYVSLQRSRDALAAFEATHAASLRLSLTIGNTSGKMLANPGAALETIVQQLLLGKPVHTTKTRLELDYGPTDAALRELQSAIPGDSLGVLLLSIHAGVISALVVLPSGDIITPLQWTLDEEEAYAIFSSLQTALEPGPFRERRLQHVCKGLGSLLLQGVLPVLRQQKVTVLAVCAPGLISHWPFEAFYETPDTSRCVGEEFRISYLPSLRIGGHLAQQCREATKRRILVVPYQGTDLKHVQAEVEGLRQLAGTDVHIFAGGKYPKLELLEELQGEYGFVHFACHGDFDLVSPLESSLELDTSRGGDAARLRALDLLQLRFKHAPVVTMSACSTSLTSFDHSNSFTGLSGSLLRAGARGIVGSRWKVYDDTAQHFMLRLYELMYTQGRPPGESVTQVQVEFRNHMGIEDWASFSYLGLPI